MLNLLSNRWMRSLRYAALAVGIATLTACGGGGGGGNPFAAASGVAVPASTVPVVPPASGVAATVASKVQLLVSSPQILSTSGAPVVLTAVVLDAANQTMPGRMVTFSIPPTETAFTTYVTPGGLSDVNGVVSANLNLGANKANRRITISAIVDGISALATVDVIGTTISISGNNSVALTAQTVLTFSVKDSSGLALQGVPVTVTSGKGNTVVLTPATGITNAAGVVTAAVTGSVAGIDTITASSSGATVTSTLNVSADSFTFSPLPTAVIPDIPLNTPKAINVAWTNILGPVAASSVSFYSTRGVITSPALTTVAGLASTTVTSSSAGPATITATGPGGTPSTTMQVNFVATTATNVVTQANPGTVQITSGAVGQTGNSSTITTAVRDGLNNLVKNARVNFTIVSDPSGGALSSPTAVTDANGIASVTYTAGAAASPQNGIVISATVVDINGVVPVAPPLPAASTVTLTASSQSLFVRLGTDNKVTLLPPTNLMKTYVALVTDSAGNAVPNVPVYFTLRPNRYSKGYYIWGGQQWIQDINTVTCLNEDTNYNGIIDAAEDINMNGKLEPGGVASVTAQSTLGPLVPAVTDANGFISALIVYAKSYAHWVEVTLEARASVVGTDPPTVATFVLSGDSADYTNPLVSPPGQPSPFAASAVRSTPAASGVPAFPGFVNPCNIAN